ncbi:MAG: hypothetical protein M3O01_13000 [Pseudomonadota bacterium]|nr:hypothetical protein [Pseudomonadota bacterium]
MTPQYPGFLAALATAAALSVSVTGALAQAAPDKAASEAKTHKPAKSSKKVAGKAAAPAFVVPAADAEQDAAAQKVYYGLYACEFKETVDIVASPKYPSYVDVKHDKSTYLMKPVVSSTGAIRLEDVRGETLMVQISSKSMLLNVKTGHRVVDDCVSPRQRELIEEARVAKAAAAAAESGAASAPVAADGASAALPAAASSPAEPMAASAATK